MGTQNAMQASLPGDPKSAPGPAPAAIPASTTDRGMLGEWWRYRELFFFFCWRDIKIRYKQTALGLLWVVIQPVFTMIVFTVIGRAANLPTEGIPKPIFYYSALLPWTYFSSALAGSSNSLLTNSVLVTKVYFPRELIPASTVLTFLFDLAISSAVLIVLMLWFGTMPTWHLLLWPLLIAPLGITAFGLGLGLSALNVKYRDVRHAIPFAIQLGLFVSPVLYSSSRVPDEYRWLYNLNPVVGVLEACRATVIPARSIDWMLWGQSLGLGLLLLVVGMIYFRRAERTFADVI